MSKTRAKRPGEDSSPEPPDGGWGWVVGFGAFIEMFLTMGTLLCCGVYFAPVQQEFDVSSAELGWIISSGSTLLSATCPIGSVCVKKFGCRVTALIGGLAMSIGFLASSFAQSSIHIFLTLGLVAGIGSGLVFMSATVILGYYFKRRYAVINGLAFSGPGVAIFVLPPLLDYLIETYGWRGSFMIQSAIALHAVAAAALFKPLPSEWQSTRKRAKQNAKYARIEMSEFRIDSRDKCESESCEEKECTRDAYDANENVTAVRIDHGDVVGNRNSDASETSPSPSESLSVRAKDLPEHEDDSGSIVKEDDVSAQLKVDNSETSSVTDSRRCRRFSFDRLSFRNNCWLLYTAAFVLICPTSFFQACAFYSLTFHVVARASLVGVSANLAGFSLSSLGAGSTFTRLTHGWLIHHGLISATTAYLIALCVGAVGAFANAITQSYTGVIIGCLLVGFSSGSVYPLVPVVLRDLVSVRGLPTTYGLAMFCDSCGVFAGGITAGLLRDVTGTYTSSFCVTGLYYLVATFFLVIVISISRLYRRRERTELESDSESEASKRLESGDYQNI